MTDLRALVDAADSPKGKRLVRLNGLNLQIAHARAALRRPHLLEPPRRAELAVLSRYGAL